MCIYKQAYKGAGKKQWFFDYIKEVHEECDSLINEDCSRFGHKKVKELDWEKTEQCVIDSFSTDKKGQWGNITTTNKMIEKDVEYWAKYGSNLFPSIVINNQTYRGQLETQAVMNALCASFNTPPKICRKLLAADDIEHNVVIGMVKLNGGYRTHHVVGICLVFTLGLMVVLYCYRRHAKRQMKVQMNTQIETAVNHYVTLSQKEADSTYAS